MKAFLVILAIMAAMAQISFSQEEQQQPQHTQALFPYFPLPYPRFPHPYPYFPHPYPHFPYPHFPVYPHPSPVSPSPSSPPVPPHPSIEQAQKCSKSFHDATVGSCIHDLYTSSELQKFALGAKCCDFIKTVSNDCSFVPIFKTPLFQNFMKKQCSS